jgi:hypothetical protein
MVQEQNMDTSESLSVEVSKAFKSVRCAPAVSPIWSEYDEEYDACRSRFIGRRWQDISPEEAMQWFDCLVYFDSDELAYYIPAFVLASLKYPDENVSSWTIGTLQREAKALSTILTSAQVRVLRSVVEFFADREPDDERTQSCLQVWLSAEEERFL